MELPGTQKHLYLPHGSHWALDMAAQARPGAARVLKNAASGHSKWPLGHAQVAPGHSKRPLGPAWLLPGRLKSPLGPAQVLRDAGNGCSGLAGCRQGARNGCSGMLWPRLSARSHCSKELVSVALSSVPPLLCSTCSVHGYAWAHTNIYIYIIYIYSTHDMSDI